MKMSNIRSNFSEMSEPLQKEFFWKYADSRADDFQKNSLVTIKQKRTTTTSKEPKLKVTEAQLMLLKALGLV